MKDYSTKISVVVGSLFLIVSIILVVTCNYNPRLTGILFFSGFLLLFLTIALISQHEMLSTVSPGRIKMLFALPLSKRSIFLKMATRVISAISPAAILVYISFLLIYVTYSKFNFGMFSIGILSFLNLVLVLLSFSAFVLAYFDSDYGFLISIVLPFLVSLLSRSTASSIFIVMSFIFPISGCILRIRTALIPGMEYSMFQHFPSALLWGEFAYSILWAVIILRIAYIKIINKEYS